MSLKITILIRKIVLLFIIGFILTSLFLPSLILNIRTSYGEYGDFPVNAWFLWYNQFSISTGRILNQASYLNSYQFFPYSLSLAFSDHLFIPSLIYSILYWVTGLHILSVNIYTLLTFTFSFVSSFSLINYFTKEKYASFLGALVFTFNPLSFAHFPGHLQLMNKFFLPLVFLFLFKFLMHPNLKNSFFLFLSFTLNALSVIYFLIFTIVLIPVAASPFIIYYAYKRNLRYFLNLTKYSLVFIIFLPLLLYFNLPYIVFSQKEGVFRTISENSLYAANLADWVFPYSGSLIYGSLVKSIEKYRFNNSPENFNYAEHTLGLNILPLILFILGLIFLWKKRKKIEINLLLTYMGLIGMAVFIFLLSLGPTLTFGRNINITLPFHYIYEYTGLFKGVRAPSRVQFLFYIPFSVFIGFGVVYLLNRKSGKYLLFWLFFLIIFLENFIALDYNSKSFIFQNYDRYIVKDKLFFLKDKTTVHFPFNTKDLSKESQYLNWVSLTGERIFNGYSGYIPQDLQDIMRNFQNGIDNNGMSLFKALDIKYLIIHKYLLDDNQKKFYSENLDQYNFGKVFEDKNILIVDLYDYVPILNKCNTDEKLQISVDKNYKINIPGKKTRQYVKFTILNSNNCYYVSSGANRYLKRKNKFDNQDFIFNLKIPLVIYPQENIQVNILSS